MAKKGGGRGTNSSSKWGDGVSWEINDYLPDWELPIGETLSQSLDIPFNADLAGRPQLFMPIYISNDGRIDRDGSNIIVLALDPAEGAVGFTQETYLLKESWDAIAADAPLFERFDPDLDQLPEYKQKTFLVNSASRPFDTPRLIPGGRFREILILIEDAQAPAPVQIGAGNDVIPGGAIPNTSGRNVVYGGAGNDTLNGGGDNDLLRGEAGDDSLAGGIGDDSLLGEAGNDLLVGGDNPDYLNGGTSNDTLYGEGGPDILDGMMGDDVIYGDYADPSLDGVSENKEFFGYDSLNSDALNGGSGNDVLFGGGGSDQVFGDDGDDYLSGGVGIDSVSGGAGADRFDFYRYRPGFRDRDEIRDFELSEDKIGIYVGTGEASSFRTVGLPLNTAVLASQFVIGSNATATNHRFILALDGFDVSAILFFDPDGSGPSEKIEIATLSGINSANISSFNHTHIVTFDDTRRRPPPSAPLPPPPSVEFAQSTLQVNENAGLATITLNRTGTLAGLSQVRVSIAGGTATAGADFNAASLPRTVTFGIGEASKTLEIPILADALDLLHE